MAGFGDNSTVFQRGAVISQGGIRLEIGEYTQATDTTMRVPTQLTRIIGGLCIGEGITGRAIEGLDVSMGFADFSLSANGNKIVAYILAGY